MTELLYALSRITRIVWPVPVDDDQVFLLHPFSLLLLFPIQSLPVSVGEVRVDISVEVSSSPLSIVEPEAKKAATFTVAQGRYRAETDLIVGAVAGL